MPGRVYSELAEIALDQYGYVTTVDAREIGVNPQRLVEMAARGTAERVFHGIYRLPVVGEGGLDQLMLATLWPRGLGVLSHETALDVHDLCDVNPAKVHVSVPMSYRLTREVPSVYQMHRRRLDPEEVTRHEGIPIVTAPRAILDGIEAHLRPGLIDQAVGAARRRGLLDAVDLERIATAR
ncbi:MAG: type IV toxin-antitoxin system AbiEi family antitoxin domain-containing protein [Solirubrobacteraceae bacterium]|nr:type IV toxin-antitoxin system AbiEi family antitoxin domain-containing protein [Solirubrobacteraceae bacterium]